MRFSGDIRAMVRCNLFICFGISVWLAVPSGAHGEPAPAPALPDTYVSRLETLSLIETLNADLLASRSATLTLEAWCSSHHMAADPKIHARLVPDVFKEISKESRQRLKVSEDTPVKYRRVELLCGDHILSQADNWYVPSRLTPEMNKTLETTDRSFGYVVKDLEPRRQTISADLLWRPLPEGFELQQPPAEHADQELAIPPLLFEHRALVLKPDGQPFSEVVETYRRDIFDFPRQH
jgi:chorismate-pyruvate lyase